MNRTEKLWKILYIVLLLASIFTMITLVEKCEEEASASEKPTRADLSAYIKEFFHGIYQARERAAKTYIPYILEEAGKAHIDPFLIAETISKESSWNVKAIGPGGEIGLCQQMKRWAPGADLSTPQGQIKQCVKRLKEALDNCGHPLPAINQYCTGECNPIIGKARFRYIQYLKARGK